MIAFKTSHREYRSFIGNGTAVRAVLPVIVTDQGIVDQFARYMYLNRAMSRSWQDAATFAVQLLLEYAEAHHRSFATATELFNSFADSLHTGTVENYEDPTGLWWQPRPPKNANNLIGQITRFTDWLALITEESQLQLNPWRQATKHEQRLAWAAYSHRRDNSFFSHLWRTQPKTLLSRSVRAVILPVERTTPLNAFPDEKFDLLLAAGFPSRSRNINDPRDLRCILICLLIHYGGLRLSEALSLWRDDVSLEAGEVVVRIYHPKYGLAPDKSMRSVFLQKQFGLQPRNTLVKANDPLFLGWKDCLITDPERCCFEVFFYPHETGLIFAKLWREYNLLQRTKPRAGEDHPYAFTTKEGRPYSHRMFRKAHKAAVERIGLSCEKILGTTPHGHRHAYGQRLARHGAKELLIKFAMHHKSINSSQAYTQPTSEQIRQSFRDLESKLRAKHSADISDEKTRNEGMLAKHCHTSQ